jgi:hypothetical protein
VSEELTERIHRKEEFADEELEWLVQRRSFEEQVVKM